ncbi:MAG: hypothetical protein RLZZ480_169 [Candidatus Parcubacteria bacterium]
MSHSQLRDGNITPRKVYDAAVAVLSHTGRLSYKSVQVALGAKPGFIEVFAVCKPDCNRIRHAYHAAKKNLPYPTELDDTDHNPGWIENY